MRCIEKYPKEYYEIRDLIVERDNYECQLCGKYIKNVRSRQVHHIDYDKENNNFDNLILLCWKCHGKTNYNRDYWKSYFLNVVALQA